MSIRQLDNLGLKLSSEFYGEKFQFQHVGYNGSHGYILVFVQGEDKSRRSSDRVWGRPTIKGQVEKEEEALYLL